MRVATISVAGERRVGRVSDDGEWVAPFNLPASEAETGVLALVEREGRLPETLSPIRLSEVLLEAPMPRPRRNIFCVGKNYHEHAHEFASSGFDSSAAQRCGAEEPDHLLEGARNASSPGRRGTIDAIR